MKTTGEFRSHRIGARLWMLAAIALLFSLMLAVAGHGTHRQLCCAMPSEIVASAAQHAVTKPLTETKPVTDTTYRDHRSMLIPVAFSVSDSATDAKATVRMRIFSHRQLDEFLRHETSGGEGEDQSYGDDVQSF